MPPKGVTLLLLLAPFLVQGDQSYPVDCRDHFLRGHRRDQVYAIHPDGTNATVVHAYCEMAACLDQQDGRGWTVFQRRMDGTLNFYRPWQQYKEGFGDASGEYWLGLEALYQLTSRRRYQLRVDMEDFEGGDVYATYSTFYVGAEEEGYKLTVGGFTDRGAGNALSVHSGMKFSTFDKDQDTWSNNCAAHYLGGYWYAACHYSNPNGVYLWGSTVHYAMGVTWYHFKGYHYSLKSITMKIRPVA